MRERLHWIAFPPNLQKKTHVPAQSRWFWGGIAAAITLGITGGWILKQDPNNVTPSTETATLIEPTGDNKAEPFPVISGWVGLNAEEQTKYPLGSLLEKSTPISITYGLMEIKTSSGDHLVVEGPAKPHLTESNQLHLQYGKVSVESLNKLNSIQIHYGAGYKVQGGDTFAISVAKDKPDVYEICSFRGKLNLRSREHGIKISVAERESLRHLANGSAQTIPFSGNQFFRHLPQRDIVWTSLYDRSEKVTWVNPHDTDYNRAIAFNAEDGNSQPQRYGMGKAKTLSIDVSGLVWNPGKHRAILKWIRGTDAMIIEKVQLYHHNKLVSEDVHLGKTGTYYNTSNHLYELTIPSENFHRGGWELRARVRGAMRTNGNLPEKTVGVLHFGAKELLGAEEQHYLGNWEYQFNGQTFMRKVKANGTLTLYLEGKSRPGHSGTWWIKNGIMHAKMNPTANIIELHMLRDKTTLIFLDQPYSNAVKVLQ